MGANFDSAAFSKDAIFSDADFSYYASFSNADFSGDANFFSTTISNYADFSDAKFSGEASFSNALFSGDADFTECHFADVSYFINARFHGALNLLQAFFRLFKGIPTKGLNLEGAIMEEANLWGVPRLEGYSFQNAFLLSISFAEREIIDCDFTGAVMDAVRTRGWKPDARTLEKTKFIYTDYTDETIVDAETGKETRVLRPLEESRVPGSGYFGQGDLQGFTLADYLKERYKWTRAVNVPAFIRTALVNYIQFFSEYARVTRNINVEIRTKLEGGKIRVEFLTETKEDKEKVEGLFQNYLQNASARDTANLHIDFTCSKASKMEQDMLVIDLKNQINNLTTKLDYTQKLLESQGKLTKSEQEKLELVQRFMKTPSNLLEAPPARKEEHLFVLKADIKGFSAFDTADRENITKALEKIAIGHAGECTRCYPHGGDALEILHHDIQALAKMALRIVEDLRQERGRPLLRVALDFGKITYETREGQCTPLSGEALRTAARLEPVVVPGQVWMTEAVKVMLDKQQGSYMSQELDAQDKQDKQVNDKGEINCKKKDSQEPDFYIKVYKLAKRPG